MDDLVKRLRAWAENESQFNPADKSRLLQSICADRIESLSAELAHQHAINDELLAMLDRVQMRAEVTPPMTSWEMAHSDEIAALGDRREALSKLQPKCPLCGHEQVQLVDYIDVIPACWKCRMCKTRFERDL